MFSRSISKSIKSPEDVAKDIASRSNPTRESVRRSPACSGSYSYNHNGFRISDHDAGNHAENLVNDYNQFMKGNGTLHYHYAITALHHTHTARSMEHLRNQLSIIQQLTATPTPAPQPDYALPQHPKTLVALRSKPQRRHVPDILHPFLLRRKLQHIQQQQSITHIQRPLSNYTLAVAHSLARAQVTAISALHPHQRLRTIAGSLIALLAIRICCERTGMKAIVNQHINNYRDQHYVHNLHHDGIHRILRRASGSQNRTDQITTPYVEYATNPMHNIPEQLQTTSKQFMANRFKVPSAPYPECRFGPHSFHRAEYYASECLKLIGTPATDPVSEARWADLSTKVQSVRRGERTSYDVIADPGPDNDHWVYSIRHTFYQAVKSYLDANTQWLNMNDRPSRHDEGPATIRVDNGASLFWPCSKETRIRINAPRVIQTAQMVHAMYRFIVKASCVISPEFVGVFGFNMRFIKTIISRANHLATKDGDEASALMFGYFLPCLMTPDVHLDIFVGGDIFQHPELYVKTSDPVTGELKKEFREVIPSRHTGTIDRAMLMNPVTIRYRA